MVRSNGGREEGEEGQQRESPEAEQEGRSECVRCWYVPGRVSDWLESGCAGTSRRDGSGSPKSQVFLGPPSPVTGPQLGAAPEGGGHRHC
jgi:hypothetical protein